MLYSREDVSFNSICLNVLEDIKQYYLLVWFKKNRLETPFKGDDVKALIKASNCETWSFISLRKLRKLQYLLCFFGFQWPNNRLKMVLASPNDQKYTLYPLALKSNVTLTRPLRFVILYFLMQNLVRWSALVSTWQQMEFEIWCGWARPYKTIAKFIMHSIAQIENVLNNDLKNERMCT